MLGVGRCSTSSPARPASTATSSRSARPGSSASCRAEVIGVERSDTRQRHPDPPRQPRLGGLPGRPVHPGRRSRSTARWRTRCYSPASVAGPRARARADGQGAPRGPRLQLPDRARPAGHGRSASSQADGDFRLPDERPERILLISGGSGITPVMSMLRTLCAEGHRGRITFLHYAPDPERAIYRERARAARRRPSQRAPACAPTPGLTATGELDGHFSLAQRRGGSSPTTREAETFACGPPALLDARPARRGRPPASSRGSTSRASCRRRLAPAERRRRRDRSTSPARTCGSRTAAPPCSSRPRHAGLSPEFGCRMGICHTCSCRKTAGTVKNLSTGEVSSSDDEEIQICVSAPVGDVVVEL